MKLNDPQKLCGSHLCVRVRRACLPHLSVEEAELLGCLAALRLVVEEHTVIEAGQWVLSEGTHTHTHRHCMIETQREGLSSLVQADCFLVGFLRTLSVVEVRQSNCDGGGGIYVN